MKKGLMILVSVFECGKQFLSINIFHVNQSLQHVINIVSSNNMYSTLWFDIFLFYDSWSIDGKSLTIFDSGINLIFFFISGKRFYYKIISLDKLLWTYLHRIGHCFAYYTTFYWTDCSCGINNFIWFTIVCLFAIFLFDYQLILPVFITN